MEYRMQLSCLAVWCILATAGAQSMFKTATCQLQPNTELPEEYQRVSGSVTFSQDYGQSVHVVVRMYGFDVSQSNKLHGFHVHESNDFSSGCNSAGGHFNPHNVNHGARYDSSRHVGDLGNVEHDQYGNVDVDFHDDMISLFGDNKISGRSIVVHAGVDDLGKGGDDGSLKTGNAGKRLACCSIVTQTSVSGASTWRMSYTLSVVTVVLAMWM